MSVDVSHGRGGAGNLMPDSTQYADGSIVRVGPEGSRGDGAFSSGRGGGGNISDQGTPSQERTDMDMVPEAATRPSIESEHHVGRGGAGNTSDGTAPVDHDALTADKRMFRERERKGNPVLGLAEKLKRRLFNRKPKADKPQA